jgi:hypothetical protein
LSAAVVEPGVFSGELRLLLDGVSERTCVVRLSAALVADLQVVPGEIALVVPDSGGAIPARFLLVRSRSGTAFRILPQAEGDDLPGLPGAAARWPAERGGT